MSKRIISIVLAVVLLVGCLPISALAANDMTNAETISLGSTIDDEISVEGEIDNYQFTLAEAGCVTLDMKSYIEYYCMVLYDEDGKDLWSKSEKGYESSVGFRQDKYSIDLNAGTYYLQVLGRRFLSWSGSYTGNYTIKTSFTSAGVNETEPNNSIDQANEFSTGETIFGQIAEGGDYDFYEISLSTSGELGLDMKSYIEYYCMVLYDEDGKDLWSRSDNGYESSVGFRQDKYSIDLNAGTYYLQVLGRRFLSWSGSYTGNYTIKTGFTSAGVNETEPNNSIAQANAVAKGETIKGQLAVNDEYDFYSFQAPAKAFDMNLRLELSKCNVSIYDSEGSELAKNTCSGNDSAGYKDVKLSYKNFTAGQTYYIKVSSYYGSTGVYSFSVGGSVSTVTPTDPDSFKDVPSSEYYYEPVKWGKKNNVISGDPNGKFRPNGSCTRAEAMVMLAKLCGSSGISYGSAFRDVKANDWFYSYVNWGVANGITSGTGNNKFSPNAKCTRAEIVTFLWKLAGKPNASGSSSFKDVKSSDWYCQAVNWAVSMGITSGTGNGKFSPDSYCTRGQMITLIYKYAN